MATSYALPGSLHSHSYSASHAPRSPSKLGLSSNSSRTLRQERSNGSLHGYTTSDLPFYGHNELPTPPMSNGMGPRKAMSVSYNSPLPLHQHDGSHDHIPRNAGTVAYDALYGKHNSHDHSHGMMSGPRKAASVSYDSPLHVHHESHDHSHDHSHDREHDHDHDHSHNHDHNHGHEHDNHDSHFHNNSHDSDSTAHDPHSHHTHDIHSHSHASDELSRFTKILLPYAERWPLLHSIMIEKDSRRIFYFMTLNFAFMIVQAFYGFVTDSLGLLSDSIHMFFDCLALAMGLFAAVASKWPASERFPYGFSKIESLSGFGNGVFLMLISIEIMIEAVERLADGRETKRLNELLIVSSLGLAINLVGMMAFGHHHHGPGHSHNHDHGHGHDHGHDDHAHSHPKGEECTHASQSPLIVATPQPAHSHHHHENQNMHGIFLHVLADTMGSAAVIVSTLLIKVIGWSGWDPLASCIIAILIFLSSLPLVSACAKQLLLTVPDDTEYALRNTLAGVSGLRGVACYTVPKFWMVENMNAAEGEKDKRDVVQSDGVLGVMHVTATRGSDLEDVRKRTRAYLTGNGMDVVVQVERDGDTKCWCSSSAGGGRTPAPSYGS